jgi:hypothetical protein
MRDFSILLNQNVVRWIGTELAFSEGSEDSPTIWQHPSISFLQFLRLDAFLDCGRVLTLLSQLDDGCNFFGIYIENSLTHLLENEPHESGSIYRNREVPEIPAGRVFLTESKLDNSGNVIEISISIGNSTVRMISGEVYEGTDGSFWIAEVDECILVQVTSGA